MSEIAKPSPFLRASSIAALAFFERWTGSNASQTTTCVSGHRCAGRTGLYGSNRYPSLFIFRSEVALRESVGIIEKRAWPFQNEHRACESFADSSVHPIQIA